MPRPRTRVSGNSPCLIMYSTLELSSIGESTIRPVGILIKFTTQRNKCTVMSKVYHTMIYERTTYITKVSEYLRPWNHKDGAPPIPQFIFQGEQA